MYESVYTYIYTQVGAQALLSLTVCVFVRIHMQTLPGTHA